MSPSRPFDSPEPAAATPETSARPQPWGLGDADRAAVAAALGRAPAGRARVVWRCADGRPGVIENHPLRTGVDGRPEPFPTTHWLVDPDLLRACGRLESAGAVAELEAELARDAALARRLEADHRRLIAYRAALLDASDRRALATAGRLDALTARGIAGIADFTRVKCVHAFLAHHLALGNALGPAILARLPDPLREASPSVGEGTAGRAESPRPSR